MILRNWPLKKCSLILIFSFLLLFFFFFKTAQLQNKIWKFIKVPQSSQPLSLFRVGLVLSLMGGKKKTLSTIIWFLPETPRTRMPPMASSKSGSVNRNSARGGHLYFRLDIIRVKGLSKHTLNTYFAGMKIDPKYAFLHAFFFNLSVMSFPKFVIWPKPYPFFQFARFCTPKRCTRVHCLVLKNNPNYVNFFTRMISNFKYKWPPGQFSNHLQRMEMGFSEIFSSKCNCFWTVLNYLWCLLPTHIITFIRNDKTVPFFQLTTENILPQSYSTCLRLVPFLDPGSSDIFSYQPQTPVLMTSLNFIFFLLSYH